MKVKKKVLMITPSLTGGSFMAFKNLAEADREHFSYTILGLGKHDSISPDFKVINIPYPRYDGYWGHVCAKYSIIGFLFEIPLYISAVFFMIFLNPKVVIFNGLATMLPLMPFAVLSRKKIVLSFRSWWDRERFKSIELIVRFSGKFIDLIYVNSEGTKENLKYVYLEEKIVVIGHHANGIYFKKRDRTALREKWRIEGGACVILYVGRMDEEKHCDFMLELIRKMRQNKKLLFLFAGEGTLKPQVEALQKEIDIVRYLGFINDPHKLAEIYTVADVLWSNADETYFARPAVEALATGTPLMVFRVPAIGEKILKGIEIKDSLVPKEIGWIIDHRKMNETLKLITDVVENNDTAKLRKSSQKYAQEHYKKNPNQELAHRMDQLVTHHSFSYVKNIIGNIKNNALFYGIFLFLFLIPFFWYPSHLYVLGEDDTGLSYYNPHGVLNVALSVWSSSDHIARFEQFSGYAAVFAATLSVIKTITFNLINIQQLAFGIILSFSFSFIVKTLGLISQKVNITAYYIAGLFYSLSVYFAMTEYYYLLPSTYAILLAPALTYYLLKAILNQSVRPILYGAIWSLFISRALLTPTFINFFALMPAFVFLFLLFNYPKKYLIYFLKYFFLYLLFIGLINSMLTFPIIASFFEKGSGALAQDISNRNDPVYIENMLSYIEQEIALPRMIYYLLNIFPKSISGLQGFRNYEFYLSYLSHTSFLMFIFPLITFGGMIRMNLEEKKKTISILILFILTLLFLSVNLADATKQIYYFLMKNTPLFNMNRIPSMKFHIPYIYYYSLLIGLSLRALVTTLNIKVKKIPIMLCFLAMTINGYFFLSGRLFTEKNDPVNAQHAMDFNSDYKKLIKDFPRVVKSDTNLLLFPLGYGFGGFITGEDDSQYYRSQLTGFKSFTGHNLFGNLKVISSNLDSRLNGDANDYYFNNNQQKLLSLTQKLNIRYIIYFKDIDKLRKFGEIIPSLTYENRNYYFPAMKDQPVYENNSYVIYKVKNYDAISQFTTSHLQSEVYFKKVADFMYFIKVKTDSPDDLIMHEGYSNKWLVYRLNEKDFHCENPQNFAKNYPKIYECKHLNNNLQGNVKLAHLLNLPKENLKQDIFEHFSNKWEINTQGKYNYYAIIFEPQKSYILGICISCLFLMTYIFYLIFYGKKQ